MTGGIFLKDLPKFEADMVRVLKKLGVDAMKHAYKVGHTDAPRSKGEQHVMYRKQKGVRVQDNRWRHKLGNLHDSFGSAVYVNGVLVQSSVKYLGGTISKKVDARTGKNGRQTVKDYLHRIHFGAKKQEIVLVVVAAMFYTRWLEKEDTGTGKFLVISPAKDYINQHYHSVVAPIYRKYGIERALRTRVVQGEYIKGLSNYKE